VVVVAEVIWPRMLFSFQRSGPFIFSVEEEDRPALEISNSPICTCGILMRHSFDHGIILPGR